MSQHQDPNQAIGHEAEKKDMPVFPDESSDEEIVTMMDVLKEEEELEQDADAVLGGSDETKCSYPDGYVQRQALYACKTCADETGVPLAGICIACSLNCHEGHQCYELYTKRRFRCDCGSKNKFPGKPCILVPDRDQENKDNSYNQNFEGKYCTCHRPYPDPEDQTEDEMIQCISCEDWFHGRHLINPVPQDYAEMICGSCMDQHSFLWFYYQTLSTKRSLEDEDDQVKLPAKKTCIESQEESHEPHEPASHVDVVNGDSQKENREVEAVVEDVIEKPVEKLSCLLKQFQENKDVLSMNGASFWAEGWRTKLCSCQDCLSLYCDHKVSFLTDPKDTIHFYEEEGKKKIVRSGSSCSVSSIDRAMESFGEMPRIQQIELLRGYNDLQTALKAFLRGFAEQNRTVTKEDIDTFFENFKRSREETEGINPLIYSCGRL